jgi:hypothetical protein
MNTVASGVTGRDPLFMQRERALLTSIAENEDQCEALASAVCDRLVALELIDDAIAFEVEDYDDGEPNRYRGQPIPWLQMRTSETVRELIGATRQLRDYAQQLESDARRTPRSGRKEHIARGYLAMAAEAWRVAESYGPVRDALLPDWNRINGIHEGVRRLEAREVAELREEIRHDLRSFDRNREGLLSLGMADYVAAEIDGNPALQCALREMREFVE